MPETAALRIINHMLANFGAKMSETSEVPGATGAVFLMACSVGGRATISTDSSGARRLEEWGERLVVGDCGAGREEADLAVRLSSSSTSEPRLRSLPSRCPGPPL
eukprot:scaffold57769_cov32-Tisochrysis_lutea.AAC.5